MIAVNNFPNVSQSRYTAAAGAATVLTFALFQLMATLITSDPYQLAPVSEVITIDWPEPKKEQAAEPKPKLQPPPAMVDPAPKTTIAREPKAGELFQGHCSFKTWLFCLARNTLLDEFRRQQRWGFTEITETTLLPEVATNSAEQQLSAMQQQQQLSLAVQQLPMLQQEAILLQLEGFTLAEIALIANSNAETVKSRLRHTRVMLASLMEDKP